MSKSHVAVVQQVCPVCTTRHDTGFALHKRLEPVLESPITEGWGMCPSCKKLHEEGYVALVACDADKSTKERDGSVTLESAYRLGPLVHLKGDVWGAIFNAPLPPKGMAFCELEVVELLKSKLGGSNEPG